ncbi:TIGR02594 family protein [Bradyrhizobium sp.]|uniref:TIGR02594 family protein n=1 Tax=Bradyrhizobium sp. TaxID=376 RepID=UPI002724B8A1|nr:TIGR02594 family protein [Bradyrhizobium sp.]MDO9296850.1 TIGR02594 family protein [Bradyrhizobium sp.]
MVAIFAVVFALASDANARPLNRGHHARSHATYHHHQHVRHHSHRAPVAVRARRAEPSAFQSFGSFGSSLVEAARSQIGNGAIYGRATLWCARFVNTILARVGHTGTGSDRAASFAKYGTRVSGPQVGAIAVMSRRGGGHVGVVSGTDAKGNPIVISGNSQGRVRETVYPAGRVYAYVLPN